MKLACSIVRFARDIKRHGHIIAENVSFKICINLNLNLKSKENPYVYHHFQVDGVSRKWIITVRG